MVAIVLARGEHRIAPWPGVRSSRQTGHGVRSHRDLGSQIGTHDSVNDTKGRPGDVFPPVRPRSENPLSFRLHAPECPPDRSRKRIKASPRDPAFPGGCEGFAMLSRINLTLSALTNRLNLGTRTLVLNASGNNGKTTLRIRHLHHDVMRQRMVWCVVPSFTSERYDIPPMPDSIIPGPQQHPIRCEGQEPSRSACQRSVLPKPSQAWLLKQARPGQHPLEPMSAIGGQDRGFGLGIRQPASTRAASCRESGSRRKLSPDRRAQKRHGSLVGRLERSMVLIGLVDGGSSTDAVVTNRAGERNRVVVSGTGPVSPAPRAAHAH